jgi:glycosyltransferase involved in cell wall biosynthesis
MPSLFPEAFGKVGVEAMSSGRPVVASDAGGVRDWLDPGINGLLVRPGNSEDLTAALIKILDDPSRTERMGLSAHQTAQRFSLELHADRLQQIFEALVAAR